MSTALYRRYRPETFADVIGQEHVTEPLMAALAADRITHAYLFSGPRGCGKTTSARILARCLNCVQGPTADPCGQCDSCVDLARGGPGSLDVVEIDAASHNGVDDARELRERAAFAPARDRYKIFILDEAHMVTTQGFNALLKVVEEPPPHIKFVFATTEPDKVIGTIRSRTHHYPFRLVAPEKLTEYLQSLAQAEGVQVAGGVLPLVVRAGGGSVRDSLSVLDQLIAGSADGEVTYERAVALLGFTHGALLDDAVDALAARDGLSLFRVVDHVIESGHAPRRFVEDLLERLRDLIVLRAAGDEAAAVLRSVPADQLERMRAQAQHMGAGALSRAADMVNDGLTEMTGATSPRLQLELLCARLLLPAADDGVDGFAARLDRLEAALAGAPSQVITSGTTSPAAQAPAATPGPGAAGRDSAAAAPSATGSAAAEPAPAATAAHREEHTSAHVSSRAESAPAARPEGVTEGAVITGGRGATAPEQGPRPSSPSGHTDEHRRREQAATAQPTEAGRPTESGRAGQAGQAGQATQAGQAGQAGQSASAEPTAPVAPAEAGGMTTDQVRRRWPEVLETLARLKRTTWALVSQDAQVMNLSAGSLALGFSTSGLATAFRSGPHAEFVAQALRETLGVDVRIEPVLNDGSAHAAAAGAPTAAGPVGQQSPGAPAERGPAASGDGGRGGSGSAGEWGGSSPARGGAGGADPAGESGGTGPARDGAGGPGSAGDGESPGPARSGTADSGPAAGTGGGWADIPVRRPPQDPGPSTSQARQGPGAAAGGTGIAGPADAGGGVRPGAAGDPGDAGGWGTGHAGGPGAAGGPGNAGGPGAGNAGGPGNAGATGSGNAGGPASAGGPESAGKPRNSGSAGGAGSAGGGVNAGGSGGSAGGGAAGWPDGPGGSTERVGGSAHADQLPDRAGNGAGSSSSTPGAVAVADQAQPMTGVASAATAAAQTVGEPAGPAGSSDGAADGALVAEPPRAPHAPAPVTRLGDELDEHSPDDPDLEHSEVVGAPLVARLLGGTVIDEEIDDTGQVN